jgi:hypothetical protein
LDDHGLPDPLPEGEKVMPTMHLVDSTLLHSVGYMDGKLYVKFLNGARYSYSGVPIEVFNDFMAAESAGKFFLTKIKNQYPTTKEE